uniref:Protein FAM228A n=1 Tax=Marmota marmota marmota TaxID=9994 RepID=A0A8C6EXW9_MARMA
MAATSNYAEHFSPENLKRWPQPEEDIDEAVHAILFRENYVVKRLDTYFQHLDTFKERRKEMLHRKWIMNTGKKYFAKELKETKDRLHAKWPPFIFTLQNVIPKESHKASGVPRKSKAFSPEKPICMEKKRLFGKEKTTNLSQLAFERQFPFSQLRKNKEAEKKGLWSVNIPIPGYNCILTSTNEKYMSILLSKSS